MEGKNPEDLINQAEEQKHRVANDSLEVFSWFSDDSGEMFLASKVVEAISEDFNWESQRVRRAITGLVDDTLDPVQQLVLNGTAHIGIIEYKEFQDFGGYGFLEYDDTLGQRKNVVCAKCVSEKQYTSEPFRAVEGYGRHPEPCSYNHLLEHLEQHYSESHSDRPDEIQVGASLVSGTTISSNTAIHGGNQSDFGVDSFGVGNLSDGYILKNSGGSLTGVQNLIIKQSTQPSNTNVLWIDDSEIWPLAKIYDNNQGAWRIISNQTAIPDTLVDNFEEILYEDQNLTLSDRYSVDEGAFARQQTTVKEGSYALQCTASSTSRIQTTDFTVSDGHTYRYYTQLGGGNAGVLWGVPDSTTFSGYYTEAQPDEIGIYRIDSGSFTGLANPSDTIPTSEFLEHEFQWGSNGDLKLVVFNSSGTQIADTTTVNDTTYSSGGIGFRVFGPSGDSFFDHVRAAIPYSAIDYFEDGDKTTRSSDWDGWNDPQGTLSVVSSNPIEGDYSGEITVPSGHQPSGNFVYTNRSAGPTTNGLSWKFRSPDTGDGADGYRHFVWSAGERLGYLDFTKDSNIDWYNGSTTTLQSWSTGTVYLVKLHFDFGNDEVTIDIDNSSYGPYALENAESDWDMFGIQNDNGQTSSQATMFFDTVKEIV